MSAPADAFMSGPVVVTGGSGFVGRAVLERLAGAGTTVRAPMRRPMPVPPGAYVLTGFDLGESHDWRPVVQGAGAVVHCAARAHLVNDRTPDGTAEYRRINVKGTLALASQAAAAGVRRFIFISSIGVNGAQTFGRPFTALDAPAPHSPYAVSKLEAEQQLQALGAATGMEVVIVRPPLVTGPGAPGNLALLLRLIDSGWPLPLGGLRDNRRSLVSRANLVDLIVRCLSHSAAAGEVLLVRDGEDLSTAELVRRLAAARGRAARLVPVPSGVLRALATAAGRGKMAVQLCGSLQVDDARTRELLGWTPPLTLNDGLRLAAARQADAS